MEEITTPVPCTRKPRGHWKSNGKRGRRKSKRERKRESFGKNRIRKRRGGRDRKIELVRVNY